MVFEQCHFSSAEVSVQITDYDQLKVRFFKAWCHDFATYLHHHHKMSSTYRITQDRISDAINALYDGDYSNLTAAAWDFGWIQRRYNGGFAEELQKARDYRPIELSTPIKNRQLSIY